MDRYAKYYREDGMEKRTLYKVFGIRFDILVNGKVRVARHSVHPRSLGWHCHVFRKVPAL